ncbi:hypothetical protein Asru_0081_04 [Acidisphaera rubrifaciens HS-AP3]|uniref:Uncharacterized protein n=1 Tax=Acidisphaera rubrifaciens HS-AP3 TaxID=1231350 RepID=A0A0D6P4Z9_9PROT|nr:hypothetical protein Asru_0081_04 [Acidisphaera rubrifaciens HS-AP3]
MTDTPAPAARSASATRMARTRLRRQRDLMLVPLELYPHERRAVLRAAGMDAGQADDRRAVQVAVQKWLEKCFLSRPAQYDPTVRARPGRPAT